MPKDLDNGKKQYICTALEQCTGLWCNGNTADSGPAFPGSSPGSPAGKRDADASLFSFPLQEFFISEMKFSQSYKEKYMAQQRFASRGSTIIFSRERKNTLVGA